MSLTAALLGLASSLLWGTSDFLGGLRSRTVPPAAVVGWSQLMGLVALTVIVLTVQPLSGTAWVPWAVAAGAMGAVALGSFYAALASAPMGIVAPIAALGAGVPVVLGVLTGDTPSPLAWLGMVVALAGAMLASGPELRAGLHVRPVALACVAAVGFGLVLFCIDRGSRTSLVSVLWGMRLTSVTLFAVLALRLRSVGGVGRSDLLVLVPIGLADLLANATFALAAARGMVSVAAVLASLYPVVTILLARGILHERLRAIQNAGVALSLVGVAVIASG
ncbi:MAG: DMT family transporter [Actinomycetota bacterium]|nr:DMT family transporter [Actinomycetota bacterium]